MIEIKSQKGVTDLTKLNGDISELAADVLVMLNAIYEAILEETNSDIADEFARYVKMRIKSKRYTPFRVISDPDDWVTK